MMRTSTMTNTLSFAIIGLMLVLLFTLVDPFMYWMPAGAQVLALTLAAAAVSAWAGLLLRERASDERETAHAARAARIAYLSGVVVLTLALVVQGIAHALDPWVPLTLGVMVLAKLLARLYEERHR